MKASGLFSRSLYWNFMKLCHCLCGGKIAMDLAPFLKEIPEWWEFCAFMCSFYGQWQMMPKSRFYVQTIEFHVHNHQKARFMYFLILKLLPKIWYSKLGLCYWLYPFMEIWPHGPRHKQRVLITQGFSWKMELDPWLSYHWLDDHTVSWNSNREIRRKGPIPSFSLT